MKMYLKFAPVILLFFFTNLFCDLSYARRGSKGGGRAKSTISAYAKGYPSTKAVSVRGYTKKNGTYVAVHKRSKANSKKTDNWSHKGSVNPYTGKKGTQKN